MFMNSKQKNVYEMIFKDPVQSNIEWRDIENLLAMYGNSVAR